MNTQEENQRIMENISKVLQRFNDDIPDDEQTEGVIMSYVLNDGIAIIEQVENDELLFKMYLGKPVFMNLDMSNNREQYCPHVELYQLTKKFMKDNSIYDLDTVLQSEEMMNRLDDFNTKVFEIMRDELDSDA